MYCLTNQIIYDILIIEYTIIGITMSLLLTNAELAILGLIAENDRHGYDIERCIEERGMRNQTEIGFSSIYYILNKLEAAGWLRGRRVNDETKLTRKVYQRTDAGKDVFRKAILTRLASPRPHKADFDLALANMAALRAEESLDALLTRQKDLQASLGEVQEKWKRDGKGSLPFQVEALFDHSVAIIRAELSWLDTFIEEFDEIENKHRRSNDRQD